MENTSVTSFPEETDLCFQGINFTGALLALAAAHSGLRVSICIKEQLNFNYQPELVPIYPLRLDKVLQSLTSYKILEKIASFYPTLIYPQRILTIIDEKKFNARNLSFYDTILKRDHDEASLPIHFSKFMELQSLESWFLNAALIHEFRFDRNMALIYLLKECRRQGISIGNKGTMVNAKLFVSCLEPGERRDSITIENVNYPFNNNLRIANPYFDTLIQKLEEKIIIRFRFIKTNSEGFFLKKSIEYISYLGVKNAENYLSPLKEYYSFKNHDKKVSGEGSVFINDSDLVDIKRNCRHIARIISTKVCKRIRLSNYFNSISKVLLDGYHFRNKQALCDEKFDLAKQSGIDYQWFCYFFFRYSDSIDDIIELAYSFIQGNRGEAKLAWNMVELIVQQKIQSEIFYT